MKTAATARQDTETATREMEALRAGKHFPIVTGCSALIMAPTEDGVHSSVLRIERLRLESDPAQPSVADMADVICAHLNAKPKLRAHKAAL